MRIGSFFFLGTNTMMVLYLGDDFRVDQGEDFVLSLLQWYLTAFSDGPMLIVKILEVVMNNQRITDYLLLMTIYSYYGVASSFGSVFFTFGDLIMDIRKGVCTHWFVGGCCDTFTVVIFVVCAPFWSIVTVAIGINAVGGNFHDDFISKNFKEYGMWLELYTREQLLIL